MPTAREFLEHPDCEDFWREIPCRGEISQNIIFLYESGCMVIIEPLPIYGFCGIHIACLKSSRGKKAIDFIKRSVSEVKRRTGSRILARIDITRREVRLVASLVGVKEYNRSDKHVFFEVL